jgi:hypothetical protein
MSNTKKSGRIPVVIDTFNAYIINTERYLRAVPAPPPTTSAVAPAPAVAPVVPNYIRLGMLDTEMNSWTSFKNQWIALYNLYSDKEESRTTAIKNKLRDVQTAFKIFAQPILTMITGFRTVTDDDAAVLHIVIHRKKPVHPVAPIEDVPVFGMFPLGGGEVKFSVRSVNDTKRASKILGADIEVRYSAIFVDEPTPKKVDDLIHDYISTKAIFILNIGIYDSQKTIYAVCRWVDVSNPSRNGPWTVIQKTPVL